MLPADFSEAIWQSTPQHVNKLQLNVANIKLVYEKICTRLLYTFTGKNYMKFIAWVFATSDLVERRGEEPAWCQQCPPEDVTVEAVFRFIVVGDVKTCLVAADTTQWPAALRVRCPQPHLYRWTEVKLHNTRTLHNTCFLSTVIM